MVLSKYWKKIRRLLKAEVSDASSHAYTDIHWQCNVVYMQFLISVHISIWSDEQLQKKLGSWNTSVSWASIKCKATYSTIFKIFSKGYPDQANFITS